MSAARDELLSRIRLRLPAGRPVREVAMFGGTAIMLENSMLVSAARDGSLLVRIDPEDHASLLERAGARPAVMGADRPMGHGWLEVDASALEDDDSLQTWLEVALGFHSR